MRPLLVVSVDTEEEFDWTAPFSSSNRSVRHVAELPRLHDVFEECGVRPTYLVDHPIATTAESIRILQQLHERGTCEIGGHLHPWVNPPLREAIDGRNSYLCNLPLELQTEKLTVLTEAIESAFGIKPASFKAGRYGLDIALAPAMHALGYRVDGSVRALEDFRHDGGPSFADILPRPFWITARHAGSIAEPAKEEKLLLEIPCSVGFNRQPFERWARVHRSLARLRWGPVRPIGLLWRLGVMRRIPLTPEGQHERDLCCLARTMTREPGAVLHLSLHSPSAAVGHTPYVRSEAERRNLFATLRATLRFIMAELQARSLTMGECPAEFSGRSLPVRAA